MGTWPVFLAHMYDQDGEKFMRSPWEKKITKRSISQEWWDDSWEVKKVVHAYHGDTRKASVASCHIERPHCGASVQVLGVIHTFADVPASACQLRCA